MHHRHAMRHGRESQRWTTRDSGFPLEVSRFCALSLGSRNSVRLYKQLKRHNLQ